VDEFLEDPNKKILIIFEEMFDEENLDNFQLDFYNNLGWSISLL